MRINVFPQKLLISHVEATLGLNLERNSLRSLLHVVMVSFFSEARL